MPKCEDWIRMDKQNFVVLLKFRATYTNKKYVALFPSVPDHRPPYAA